MSKPMLYVMRTFFALELLVAVVFTPTLRAIRLIPFWLIAWAIMEIGNTIKTRKETNRKEAEV